MPSCTYSLYQHAPPCSWKLLDVKKNKAKDLQHSRLIPLGLRKEDYILRDLAMVLDEDTDEEEEDEEEDDDDEIINDIFDGDDLMDDSAPVGANKFWCLQDLYESDACFPQEPEILDFNDSN